MNAHAPLIDAACFALQKTRRASPEMNLLSCAILDFIRVPRGSVHPAPDKGDDLSAGAVQIRAEFRCARFFGGAVLHRPLDGVLIVAVLRHIHEHICLRIAYIYRGKSIGKFLNRFNGYIKRIVCTNSISRVSGIPKK